MKFHANSDQVVHHLKPGGRVIFYEDGTVRNGRSVTVLRIIDSETLVLDVGSSVEVIATWDNPCRLSVLASIHASVTGTLRKRGSWDYVV